MAFLDFFRRNKAPTKPPGSSGVMGFIRNIFFSPRVSGNRYKRRENRRQRREEERERARDAERLQDELNRLQAEQAALEDELKQLEADRERQELQLEQERIDREAEDLERIRREGQRAAADARVEEEALEELNSLFQEQRKTRTDKQEDKPEITVLSDEELLEKYQGMLTSMIEHGFIKAFPSDKDAAEFLRVLSSQAWNSSRAAWYNEMALQQIQDAIRRGATAGALQAGYNKSLQNEYNREIQKKTTGYLSLWENWASRTDWPDDEEQEKAADTVPEPAVAAYYTSTPKPKKLTRKQKKKNRYKRR